MEPRTIHIVVGNSFFLLLLERLVCVLLLLSPPHKLIEHFLLKPHPLKFLLFLLVVLVSLNLIEL